ncbi:cilia- and flagella-associated protein 161-like isoform X2 [Hyposmocoma kahamanoa]|nr:cilia- and flagella-associated protein 161-like isoform X2 [Hyposmocoma kahamanoa]
MSKNLLKPADLTQSTGSFNFGSKICLLAPYVSGLRPSQPDNKGLLLGGRISSNDIDYSQELEDGCTIAAFPDKTPYARSTFVVTSSDYCNREKEYLKYNQEFLLTLSSSIERKKPLYIRYDPNPIPGLIGTYPLYLSEHPVSNTRWRVLPKQRPDLTRFEQEGEPVHVNTDVIINHCATNVNLGINTCFSASGFYGKMSAPLVKTCLDVYGRELPNNIWHFYVPLATT